MPERAYNREDAVAYAMRWALGRNPAYYDFENLGGDCTNFASQCLYAGSEVMNPRRTFGWYYYNLNNRSPSWTAVQYLQNFLLNNTSIGPYVRVVTIEEVMPGDVIQLCLSNGRYYHSPVVAQVGLVLAPDNVLLCAHTYDALLRPLSDYTDAASFLCLHVVGVRY